MPERPERNKNNPKRISDTAIETTLGYLSGEPIIDLTTLRKQLDHAPFADILYDEFQAFRIGLSWEIDVPTETREKFGVKVATIDSMGPDELEGDSEEAMDLFIGVGLLRAFIASTYVEQANIDQSPTPDINDKLIDVLPVGKERLNHVYAGRKGMFVIDADDLEDQWKQENPRLHQEAMKLKDWLVETFTPRTFRLYKDLPAGFVEHLTPTLRQTWDYHLKQCALSTYTWFTPNKPALIPVRVKEKQKNN